ncbi:hypothetical protein [Staphylococcus warneri]|uniref:hypothetical protein n=1 Tax=Staphylococcus warneri TaxID=1292 RepID=UPI00155FEB04|nr:hypothetical protein [Staphylococcus warneri]MBO0378294.1 hypothetical protein [Staphylococcus warneri]MDU9351862.1 hypothetical protein [Staphylococcus warneri]QKI07966.1 hypothetical protein FOC62_10235 [Staphylococcus warneri]
MKKHNMSAGNAIATIVPIADQSSTGLSKLIVLGPVGYLAHIKIVNTVDKIASTTKDTRNFILSLSKIFFK